MNAQNPNQAHNTQRAQIRPEKVVANSGATSEHFGEPQGWALKWDGAALPDDTKPETKCPSSGAAGSQ